MCCMSIVAGGESVGHCLFVVVEVVVVAVVVVAANAACTAGMSGSQLRTRMYGW